jgi:hypothetical protein
MLKANKLQVGIEWSAALGTSLILGSILFQSILPEAKKANFTQSSTQNLSVSLPTGNSRQINFFKMLAPHAEKALAEANSPVPAKVVLAIAALESDYGRAAIAKYNLWGVKAVSGQPFVIVRTREVYNGQSVMIDAKFAKYSSFEDGIKANQKTICAIIKYQGHSCNIFKEDWRRAVKILGKLYATDPLWANSVTRIVDTYFSEKQQKAGTNKSVGSDGNETSSHKISSESFAYFKEVAFDSEFSNSSDRVIRKWVSPVKIRIIGSPTLADRNTLKAVVSELSGLTDLNFEIVDGKNKKKSNVNIHFAPEEKFASILPDYKGGNSGFFWVNWNEAKHITQATILISTTGITQKERSHLIREELTQSMGLMADSQKYPDSIFYQGWTEVNEYSAVDKQVIQMLYDPQVKPGMDEGQLKQSLWG